MTITTLGLFFGAMRRNWRNRAKNTVPILLSIAPPPYKRKEWRRNWPPSFLTFLARDGEMLAQCGAIGAIAPNHTVGGGV